MNELAVLHGVFDHVARGGGGGSDSGGGGMAGIVLIGYAPMHLVGGWLRKHFRDKQALWYGVQAVGWLVAVVYAVLLTWSMRGLGFLAAIGAITGMGAGLNGWLSKLKQSKKTQQELAKASATDSAWNEQQIVATASQIFERYQQDWSNNNAEAMRPYMTPSYQHHAALMIYALQLAGRRDTVANPVISQAMVTDMVDAADNSQDQVTVGFTAVADDQLTDTHNNTVLFTDKQPFTEFWRFRRAGNGWLLDGIQQATEAQWKHNPSLEQFAAANGYYFSLDMGWLFLPSRGQLFKDGKFGTSDINNHVIGLYEQRLLVQIYSYQPKPDAANNYLIAQVFLPRSYGDIVVRRKKGLRLFGIHGLQEVSTEWPDFNKKYQVYATSPEQATSLELLNPKYMQQLEAAPFEVNIEVVDNVVYLYAPEDKTATAEHYNVMLGLLHSAFQEMRM